MSKSSKGFQDGDSGTAGSHGPAKSRVSLTGLVLSAEIFFSKEKGAEGGEKKRRVVGGRPESEEVVVSSQGEHVIPRPRKKLKVDDI